MSEGRELPIESRRAALRLAQAKQRLADFDAVREQTEASLAVVLGFGPDDRVRATTDEPPAPELPGTKQQA